MFHVNHLGGDWQVADGLIADAVAATVSGARLCSVPPGLWDADDYELSLALGTDADVQELNRNWRGQDKPTNVLSFPTEQIEPGGIPPQPLLGDLVFAQETCAREAKEQGKRVDDHFTHLLVHGLLHLYGYDHLDEEGAEAMECLEREILAGLGIADPYAHMDARPDERA